MKPIKSITLKKKDDEGIHLFEKLAFSDRYDRRCFLSDVNDTFSAVTAISYLDQNILDLNPDLNDYKKNGKRADSVKVLVDPIILSKSEAKPVESEAPVRHMWEIGFQTWYTIAHSTADFTVTGSRNLDDLFGGPKVSQTRMRRESDVYCAKFHSPEIRRVILPSESFVYSHGVSSVDYIENLLERGG